MEQPESGGDDAQALASLIGGRVRAQRQERAWTLDRLASEAGVSRRMLVSVEQGEANPSIATLLRISDALGIGLPALVEPPRQEGVRVTRQGEGAILWTGGNGGRGILVAGTEPPDVVELWEWTLGPGDRHESEAHVRGTTELVQVLDGTLTLVVGEEETLLGRGDAASFRSDVPHAYINDAPASTTFSLCVFEPGVGSGHGRGGQK